MNLDKLTREHGIEQQLCFKTGQGGLTLIEVRNRQCTAVISLQGAQILSWIPVDDNGEAGEDVIWLSTDAVHSAGKAIRGGIPVCWPWFGAHPDKTDYPAHGFARTSLWQILGTESLEDGSTRINLTMLPQASNQQMWPVNTTVLLQVTLGAKLEIELITRNQGDAAITISQALHTYFRVADVNKVRLHGLDDTVYLDKLENYAEKYQQGPVVITEEVDRIYLNTTTDCVIEDPEFKRNIIIIKCGSHSTVVWNPWRDTAEKMGDLGENGYKTMLCVESSNAATDTVTIDAGKEHHLWVQYNVERH